MSKAFFWWVSNAVSLALMLLLALQWNRVNASYEPNRQQLVDAAAVQEELGRRAPAPAGPGAEPPILLPTGVFVESLRFVNSSDVHMTGYVWQRYHDDLPGDLTKGFVLPEAVDSGGATIREAYRRRQGDEWVIGWYVEATLRQTFDYSRFPLDHKTVWMRFWHADFDRDVILIPDLASYDSTGLDDAFGIDQGIVLDGWKIAETYFNYREGTYDTNFGIRAYAGQHEFPELHFNVVIHRDFLDAFITNLVPLAVVAMLLFAMMLTVTNDPALKERFGFSTSEVVGASSALFFVVMLAHVQLRREFPGSGTVYIGMFYFMMYAVILGVVANTYLFSSNRPLATLRHHDNLIPKISYWPVILATMNAITLVVFWGGERSS